MPVTFCRVYRAAVSPAFPTCSLRSLLELKGPSAQELKAGKTGDYGHHLSYFACWSAESYMQLHAPEGLPEITASSNLGTLIADHIDINSNDIVCVASTVVSKAEARTRSLSDFPPGPRATELTAQLAEETANDPDERFIQAVLEESVEILLESPFLLTETRFGHVGVNAGIDRSNVGHEELLLLPKHPSKSANRIAESLSTDQVIVTDTCGRPFRHGQRGVAIGWSGIEPSRDWRGETDRDGRELTATVENVIDELAAAANLLAGEGNNGTPVVVIRDFEWGPHAESSAHFRDINDDLIRQAVRGWTYA